MDSKLTDFQTSHGPKKSNISLILSNINFQHNYEIKLNNCVSELCLDNSKIFSDVGDIHGLQIENGPQGGYQIFLLQTTMESRIYSLHRKSPNA